MMKRKIWTKVVLIAGALMCVSAALPARPYGRGWWQKPDSDPIPNLTFNTLTDGGVQSKHGLVNEIVVKGYKSISKESFSLEDNAVNGAVVDGEVRIQAMTLTGDGIQVQLPALIATLKPNYFNSKFWTDSTATVTAFIGGVRVTREIPVSVHGSIRESDGTYILDAEVRGLLKTWVKNEENQSSRRGYGSRYGFRPVSTTDTLTTFKVVLCGQATQAEPPTVETSATDTTCFGGADGTASAVASGGTRRTRTSGATARRRPTSLG